MNPCRPGLWLSLLLLTLLSGCALPPPTDPALGAQALQRAEALIVKRDFPAASEQLALAYANLPQDGQVALRHAEILENLQQFAQAASVYRQSLKRLPSNDPARPDLNYRLALLLAFHLNDLPAAEKLYRQLDPGSLRTLDLHAVLELRQGHNREALILLERGLQLAKDEDLIASLSYHAALVHEALGENVEALKALYQAINLARHQGLVKEIELFWGQVNPALRKS